jgi:hypothetical protein
VVPLIPGRLAKVLFPGTSRLMAFEIVNIHLEVEIAPGEPGHLGARCGFVGTLSRSLAPRSEAHTIVGGDWNCSASDEPRFNPVEGTLTTTAARLPSSLRPRLSSTLNCTSRTTPAAAPVAALL